MKRSVMILAATAGLLTSACLDVTDATGELGHIDYRLYTDYDPGLGDLTEVGIVTGHTQVLYLDLTASGEDAAGDLGSVQHSVSPSEGVTLRYGRDDELLEELEITVTSPGTYTLTTQLDGAVFDTISLDFEAPAELRAVTWLREPGAESFVEAEAATPVVPEGTQVSFVGIPYDPDGERLAGELALGLEPDPAGSVVAAFDTWGSYEDGIVGSVSEASVYFIEGGAITLSLIDEPNGVVHERSFEVTPAF